MLTYLQKVCAPRSQTVLMASQRSFGTVAAHSRMPTEKDYYNILEIGSDATPE